MSRTLAVLEPELEGQIAIRRRAPGDPGDGLARRTIAPQRAGASPERAAPAAAPEVADFESIEDYLRSYLEHEGFRSAHPLACGRWVVAWEMLWCADSRAKVIGVGHRARDAMQAFASSLLERVLPLAMDPHWPDLLADPAQRPEPLEAIASVIGTYRGELGDERYALLSALVEQWRALLEAVQRHELHPQTVDERLRWEDGRRLVLFTALVMVETDRSFA